MKFCEIKIIVSLDGLKILRYFHSIEFLVLPIMPHRKKANVLGVM